MYYSTPFFDSIVTSRPSRYTRRRNFYSDPLRLSFPDTGSFDNMLSQVVKSVDHNLVAGNDNSNNKEFQISLDLPGVKAEDLNIQVDDGVLSIAGFRRVYSNNNRADDGNDETNAIKKSRFSYSMTIDSNVIDTSKVSANLADGVLLVTAPKLPKSKPVNVTITTNPHLLEEDKKEKEAEDMLDVNEKEVEVKTNTDKEKDKENTNKVAVEVTDAKEGN